MNPLHPPAGRLFLGHPVVCCATSVVLTCSLVRLSSMLSVRRSNTCWRAFISTTRSYKVDCVCKTWTRTYILYTDTHRPHCPARPSKHISIVSSRAPAWELHRIGLRPQVKCGLRFCGSSNRTTGKIWLGLGRWLLDNYNLKSHEYVCITTYQQDTNSRQ